MMDVRRCSSPHFHASLMASHRLPPPLLLCGNQTTLTLFIDVSPRPNEVQRHNTRNDGVIAVH